MRAFEFFAVIIINIICSSSRHLSDIDMKFEPESERNRKQKAQRHRKTSLCGFERAHTELVMEKGACASQNVHLFFFYLQITSGNPMNGSELLLVISQMSDSQKSDLHNNTHAHTRTSHQAFEIKFISNRNEFNWLKSF